MKKIFSFLLAVIMIFSFCACTAEKEQQDNKDDTLLNYTVDSHYSTYDESVIRAYNKLCEAVEKGETSVKFNYTMADSVNQLFYTCYPLYSLVSNASFTEDNSAVTITYINDIETHKKLVAQFKEKLNSVMEKCGYNKVGLNEYIFNVYTYISKNIVIDSSVTSSFEALLQGKGIEAAVNSLFEYLVLQGGGRACHAINLDGASTMISTANFNGKWYYFDPASEARLNAGKALTRFAMNDENVKKLYSVAGFTYTDGEKIVPITDKSYSSLINSTEYKIDNSKVDVTLSGDDKVFSITFN